MSKTRLYNKKGGNTRKQLGIISKKTGMYVKTIIVINTENVFQGDILSI